MLSTTTPNKELDFISSGLFGASVCLGSVGFGASKLNNPEGLETVLFASTVGLF